MLLCDVDYDAERARDFVAFTFRHPDELALAVDLLTTCRRKGRGWSEVVDYYRINCGVPLGALTTAISFLVEQHLVTRTRKRPDQESVLRAAPRALDELLHRIEHNGEASEPPDPNLPRRAARERLDATLHAVGFRDDGNRRLRAVK
jgi:hypothetical protein